VPADEALIGGLAFVTGTGFGCVMPTTQVTLQTVAGRKRLGVVTALMALARSTGGATGAALLGAVAFTASRIPPLKLWERAEIPG
jgi:hypothetical protein